MEKTGTITSIIGALLLALHYDILGYALMGGSGVVLGALFYRSGMVYLTIQQGVFLAINIIGIIARL